MILNEECDHIKCDRCGDEFHFDDNNGAYMEFWSFIRYELFSGKQKPKPDYDFCFKCSKEVTPLYYALRDISELSSYIYKLEKEIKNAKRNKNNGST